VNILSFSGGKDSTATGIYMKEHGIQIDMATFFDTGWEFPQMYNHIKLFEKRMGIKVEVIKPRISFDYLMTEKPTMNKTYGERNGFGWPTMLRRWCTREKKNALDKWKKQFTDAVFYIGIAADEDRPLFDDNVYPLIDANITEYLALQMCYDYGFDFGGLYEHFRRVSCWCCPLGGKKRARILWEYYPELWQQIKDTQDRIGSDRETFIEGLSYADLEMEFSGHGQIGLFQGERNGYF